MFTALFGRRTGQSIPTVYTEFARSYSIWRFEVVFVDLIEDRVFVRMPIAWKTGHIFEAAFADLLHDFIQDPIYVCNVTSAAVMGDMRLINDFLQHYAAPLA